MLHDTNFFNPFPHVFNRERHYYSSQTTAKILITGLENNAFTTKLVPVTLKGYLTYGQKNLDSAPELIGLELDEILDQEGQRYTECQVSFILFEVAQFYLVDHFESLDLRWTKEE